VVDFGDGWLPARITLATFTKRVAYLREVSQKAGRPMSGVGVMPLTSVARDKETALGHVNIKGLIDEANKNSSWVKPPNGTFSTLDDIHGLIVAGTPNDIAQQVRAYQLAGADLVVFDLRFRYSDWVQQIDLLAPKFYQPSELARKPVWCTLQPSLSLKTAPTIRSSTGKLKCLKSGI